MIDAILGVLQTFVAFLIDTFGYGGIVIAMAIESACIPLPSEIIMTLSGMMVAEGKLSFWLVVLAGAVGNVLGSIAAYYGGQFGGRPFLKRYGKYVLVNLRDLDRAEKWFTKYGDKAILFSRMMPVVRTFISFPAGVAQMRMDKFILYTFVGSVPFCIGLTWIGFALGENWEQLKTYWHGLDLIVGLAVLALIVWYVRRHLREAKEARLEDSSEPQAAQGE